MNTVDPLADFLEELGLVSLRQMLDDDALTTSISERVLLTYAKVAASAWAEPPYRLPDGTTLREFARSHVAVPLFAVATGYAPIFEEDENGTPFINGPIGRVEVTEYLMRHWWWMLDILSDKAIADRVVALVPGWRRADVAAAVDAQTQYQFEQLVATIATGTAGELDL
jgi:hypothetical protein